MATSIGISYAQPQMYWSQPGEVHHMSRGEIVRSKLHTIRSESRCIRCLESGHHARDCVNKLVCLLCDKLGHKARDCRARIVKPPAKYSLPKSSPSHKPSHQTLDPAMAIPIRTFHTTPASDGLDQAFARSILLVDPGNWGPDRAQRALARIMPHHNWIVRTFEDNEYLVEAPSPHWLESTLARGTIRLENQEVQVRAWDPGYDAGLPLIPLWLRIRNFPMKLWHVPEFEKLLDDYGCTVLDLDPRTSNHTEWRFARVRVGACDPALIPPRTWIKFCNPDGRISRFDVYFEIEGQMGGNGGHWPGNNHGGGGNGPRAAGRTTGNTGGVTAGGGGTRTVPGNEGGGTRNVPVRMINDAMQTDTTQPLHQTPVTATATPNATINRAPFRPKPGTVDAIFQMMEKDRLTLTQEDKNKSSEHIQVVDLGSFNTNEESDTEFLTHITQLIEQSRGTSAKNTSNHDPFIPETLAVSEEETTPMKRPSALSFDSDTPQNHTLQLSTATATSQEHILHASTETENVNNPTAPSKQTITLHIQQIPRRSTRLKVQGLTGSIMAKAKARTQKQQGAHTKPAGFEAISGIKMNLNKTEMFPINISTEHCADLAHLFGCKQGNMEEQVKQLIKALMPQDWNLIPLQEEHAQSEITGTQDNMLQQWVTVY